MKKFFIGIALIVVLGITGCSVPRVGGLRVTQLNKWYIPGDYNAQREPVPLEHVVFLDTAPKERKYQVIGYVVPQPDAFKSLPDVINAVRAAASLHGADAVFIANQDVMEGWNFNFNRYGGGGGKWRKVQIRANAIVWEQ